MAKLLGADLLHPDAVLRIVDAAGRELRELGELALARNQQPQPRRRLSAEASSVRRQHVRVEVRLTGGIATL
jgi:hypothetical protein